MNKLKPEVRQQWCVALRSGQYRQAKGLLRDDLGPHHCCLGVLCEIAVGAGVAIEVTNKGGRVFFNENSIFPPGPVLEWAGSPNPDQLKTLARLNDEGVSFARIADYIEENL